MTPIWQSFSRRVRPGLFITLLITLISVYFITYSAFFQSQDTTRIYDAASSFARFGDFGRDETLWRDPPDKFEYVTAYPVESYDTNELMMPALVSLWFRVVDALPTIGLVHGTWLFNIIVVALVCGVFFQYARLLGYTDDVALVGALLLGVATALWVYSKTLFREPLVALFLLLAAMLLDASGRLRLWKKILLIVLGFVFVALAILTKNSAIMALPALEILLLRDTFLSRNRLRHLSDGLLIVVILSMSLLALSPFVYRQAVGLASSLRLPSFISFDSAQEALFTYLFSTGGSLWGTSPILLLGIVGAIKLIHLGQRRLLWCVVLMIIGYASGHAVATGQHWFGGVAWPPRFLIPVLPFAMLLVLPVLDWLMQNGRSVIWRIGAGVLIVYSVSIQVIGGLSRLLAYNALLPPEARGLHEWAGGLNDVRYLRWVLLPRSWDTLGFDTAWSRIDAPYFAFIFAGLALTGLFILWQWHLKRVRYAVPILALVLVMTVGVELRLLYQRDTFYEATNPELFEVLAVLGAEAGDGEPLLVEANADVTHERFIMNYNHLRNIRPIVLEIPPAEAASEEAPGCVRDWVLDNEGVVCTESDYPPAMLDWYSLHAIDHLAAQHERIWFLAHNSQFLTWSVRPIERYLNERFYLLREVRTPDPTVRLLEYSTVQAPNRYQFRLPEYTSDLVYGDAIDLTGFTLPQGTTYQAGDVVPITLFWQANEPIAEDYVVAWFIVHSEGVYPNTQGIDAMPDYGFAPTSQWQDGVIVWDNRAVVLPSDVPAGIYHIWVLMYPAASSGSERLPVTGSDVIENTIGVLPVEVMVTD